MSTSRKRSRHYPDWVDNLPGWESHYVSQNVARTVTLSDQWLAGSPDSSMYGNSPKGQETTLDDNHRRDLDENFKFPMGCIGDAGGEFELTRSAIIVEDDCPRQRLQAEGFDSSHSKYESNFYLGPITSVSPTRTGLMPAFPNPTNLAPLGTHAIAMVKPTNNVANLATDLAEARTQGLPHFWGAHLREGKTSLARSAGDEYLNHEFGWVPLMSDIRGASYAAANAHRILKSYEANSHKLVRRRYDFPVETTVVGPALYLPNQLGNIFGSTSINQIVDPLQAKGNVYKTTRTYKRTWFSGAFTYHLPLGYKSRNELVAAGAKAGPLLGIELTPEVVWNATPWTWAIDWFSNTGDVVSNVSDMANDGLVIQYGYIMEHQVTSCTYTYVGYDGWKPAMLDRPSSITAFVETKRRKRATPFGFEITWNGLSLRQLAIASALGLTRWF